MQELDILDEQIVQYDEYYVRVCVGYTTNDEKCVRVAAYNSRSEIGTIEPITSQLNTIDSSTRVSVENTCNDVCSELDTRTADASYMRPEMNAGIDAVFSTTLSES